METLYFVLGVLAVVAVAAVVGMFRIKSELKEFTKNEISKFDELIGRRIVDLERDIYRDLDSQVDHLGVVESNLTKYIDELYASNNQEIDKVYGFVDSRVDKLTDSVAKHISDLAKRSEDVEASANQALEFANVISRNIEEINARFNDNTAFVDRLAGSVDVIKQQLDENVNNNNTDKLSQEIAELYRSIEDIKARVDEIRNQK